MWSGNTTEVGVKTMITLLGGIVQKVLGNRVMHLLSGGSQSLAMKVAAVTNNKLTIITTDWVQE